MKISENSGVRWWKMGSAAADSARSGTGVGPVDAAAVLVPIAHRRPLAALRQAVKQIPVRLVIDDAGRASVAAIAAVAGAGGAGRTRSGATATWTR